MKNKTGNIVRVLLVSRSFEHHGGVVNYVQLLLKYSDPGLVGFDHVVVGKTSPTSPFWRRPFEYSASLIKFIYKLLSVKPDLVHLNPSLSWRSLPLGLTLLLFTKALSKSRTLLFFRGWDDAIAVAMIQKKLLARFIQFILSSADYFLVLSDAFREKLVAAGFPPGRISVSSVMVETEQFMSSTRLDHEIKEENIFFNVLYLSRLEREKGIWLVMDAMDWLHQFHPTVPIRLIIAGEGTERESLVKAIATKPWKDRAEFVGYVRGEEKYKICKKSDLFIFPSAHPEGFPNAVLEALAAGLPLIYTPVGVLNEILGPQNGIRMDLDDLSGEILAKHIWTLYSDREQRQNMAVTNRKLAKTRFDVSVVCNSMAAIYHKIVNEKMNYNISLTQPIFIVGLHRTGSTLFKNMLNLNSEIAMATDEMDFSDPWYRSFDKHFKGFGDLTIEQNRKKLIDFVFEGNIHSSFWKEYRALGISKHTILDEFNKTDYSLKSLVTILLDEYRKKEQKKRVGAKYPVHISRLKLLFEWFPDAKIIFLIRDVRAIIASKLNDEKTRDRKNNRKFIAPFIHYFTVLFFIVDYVWATIIFRKYRDHPNFMKVRYEDLVANPDQFLKHICDFCDVPFEAEMYGAFGKASSHTGEVTTGFDLKKISYWKKKLGKMDNLLITAIAYPCMIALGYGSIEKEYIQWNTLHEQK